MIILTQRVVFYANFVHILLCSVLRGINKMLDMVIRRLGISIPC